MCAKTARPPLPRFGLCAIIRMGADNGATAGISGFFCSAAGVQRDPAPQRRNAPAQAERSAGAVLANARSNDILLGSPMFGFGNINKDPLADVRSAGRWIASFPENDPLAIQQGILAELGRVSDRTARRTPSGLAAVFRVDAQANGLRKALTTQYIEHVGRASAAESQFWQALFDLTQAFLTCYGAFARDIAGSPQNTKSQALLPELVARQIIHLGLDAKIRLYRFEQWIPAKWVELHAIFTAACSQQIERRQIAVDADGGTTTIEHEYLVTLVLQLMNSGNLTPKHLEWATSQLDDWCQPLRLTLESSPSTSFYVDLGGRAGLKRRLPTPLEGRVLFLDTRPLHALLMQNVVVLEQKIRTEPLSDKMARRSGQLALMTKLASQVDPDFKPFARRGERSATVGTVDSIVGFAKISGYLREEEDRAPTAAFDRGKSYGGSMELAVFGHTRNEKERIVEFSERRLASFVAPGGSWEVKDASQTGFRLLAPMSVTSAVTLGTLAAIRPQGHGSWILGVVRRMKRLTTDRAEIGLQVIANMMVSVDLIEQQKPLVSSQTVDTEAPTINGRSFYGLFLSLRKRDGDPAVQSLIVPAVEYQPAKRFKLQTSKSTNAIRLGRLLEQQPDWVWTAVEPHELSGNAADAVVSSL